MLKPHNNVTCDIPSKAKGFSARASPLKFFTKTNEYNYFYQIITDAKKVLIMFQLRRGDI